MSPKKPAQGRPSGASSAETRAKLITAGRRLFGERGYGGTRTAEIVATAGVSPPALYHHFGSKAGLYTAVLTDVYDIIVASFSERSAQESTFVGKLSAILDAAGELFERDPTIAMFVASIPAQLSFFPELRDLQQRHDRVREYLSELVQNSSEIAAGSRADVVRAANVVLAGLGRMAGGGAEPGEFAAYIEASRLLVTGAAFNPPSDPLPPSRQ